MKKRVFLFLFLLTAFIGRSYAQWGFSAQTVNGQWIMCTVIDDTAHTVSVSKFDNSTSTSGDLVIPSTVTYDGQTYTVIGIAYTVYVEVGWGGHWFTFGDGFVDCSGLTSVTIPNTVTCIGPNAFASCSGLTSVTIPSAVTYIGHGAFRDCSGLTSVNFNADSCTNMNPIYDGLYEPVFDGCSNLTTLNIGNNVKVIPQEAFHGCSGLTSVTIPRAVTTIGYNAFGNCSGLTTVNFNADSCTNRGGSDGVFNGCSSLTTINIGNNVRYIPDGIFSTYDHSNGNITSLTLPNSLISIGEYAFGGCSGLTSLTLPDALETIGEGAFYVCSGLTTVSIPRTVKYIGDAAFGGCEGLTSVDMHADSCTYMGSVSSSSGSVYSAFYNCPNLATLNIDENVKNIPAAAFAGCTGLMSLRVPSSVERIGDRAFSDCYNISRIDMLSDVPPSIMGGTFYNVATTVPIWVPCGASETYRNASFWSMFINYHEDCGSEGIDPAEAEGCRIAAESGVLRIEGAAGKSVRIFDMAGRLLVSENGAQESQRFAMPAGGVYLVQVGEAPAQKVVVVK